jgi:Cellulase (glycosyl hydrolase family 5)
MSWVFGRWGLAFMAGVLVLVTGCRHEAPPATSTGRRALPKVRVAKDGRGFVTSHGRPFVPWGVTYYRPGTGWAPQVWKQFDADATRTDFARMKAAGVNCVRVFLSYGSFYSQPGVLRAEGLAKFDEFLALAEQAGIYVHPTGPDHWEGPPSWDAAIGSDEAIEALETFWKLFAARYRGRNVIFAYDLRNEPEVPWDSPALRRKWNSWLRERYGSAAALQRAWAWPRTLEFGSIEPPPDGDALGNRRLLDYQRFRESVADEWTRRQAAVIRSADPGALITVGLIQWSVPALLPGRLRHYSAFRPERQARFLDFMEVHFYPFADGAYEYRGGAETAANLAYLESVVREVARCGKPLVLAEFGWYGGGRPRFDQGRHPPATEQQQADYCREVVETSAGYVCGWLNWGFYDQPEATDCSQFTGLATAAGTLKAWGRVFEDLGRKLKTRRFTPPPARSRPDLDWEACRTSLAAEKQFRAEYLRAFEAEPRGK